MRRTLLTLTALAGLSTAATFTAAAAQPMPPGFDRGFDPAFQPAQFDDHRGPDWRADWGWRHREWERHRRWVEWHRWHDGYRRGW